MKLLVIGGGNMGFTYAKSILDSGQLSSGSISILETYPPRIEELKAYSGLTISDSTTCVTAADIILLAIKPQQSKELFASIKHLVDPNQLFISVMAGVTIETIQNGLGIQKVARAMPNLPAQLGKGMTGFTGATELTEKELGQVQRLLETTGKAMKVASESAIDAVTGISGSGPAYVFYFMQGMIDAAIKMGFTQNDAKLMVSQTFEGAVAQFKASDDSLLTWMERVASKGGTTRAALDSFDENNVNKLIQEAAFAAQNRAIELGKK
jgi:pyrroline-5-carboxylate reductase